MKKAPRHWASRHRVVAAHRVLAVLMAVLCFTVGARAQTAGPEGNAHPQEQMVSGESVPNVFGDPAMTAKPPTEAENVAFARAVDLTPLRTLAVFHQGRVKLLETLAKETVLEITGRKSYRDYLKPLTAEGEYDEKNIEQYDYDPMFTLIDAMMDVRYYADKALIGVGYLPLREAILEAEFGADEAKIKRWKKVGRVSPMMLVKHGDVIHRAHESELAYVEAMARVRMAWEVLEGTASNLLVVAPGARDEKWEHLATLPAEHPARVAALEMGRAWRARDAAGVNAATATLAEILPTVNPGMYPTTKRTIEKLYNRSNAFEYGAWGYFFALVSLLLAFGTGRGWLKAVGAVFLALAVALHGFGFITRCIIAERFAIQNQFESMTGLSLFGTIVGVGLLVARRQWLFAAATAGVGFIVLLAATQAGIPGESISREAAILNTSVLLKYHVTTVLASYGLISLGFMVSLFYLGTHYFGKKSAAAVGLAGAGAGVPGIEVGSDEAVLGARERTLKDLDTAQMTALQLAFWTLGVGILLGAWWADHSWGRWWGWDPKETWALITWIVYLIVIHVRLAMGGNRGLATAWLSVAGFIVMLWTYFGVNLILPGLHAYA